jgi:membrane associated rhomboid family serine protease
VSSPAPSTRDKRYDGFLLVFAMVALMWVSEIIDTVDHHRLDSYGIEPRDVDGLTGVVAAPFLHGGFDHLMANTVPSSRWAVPSPSRAACGWSP